jgi:hypothetical protein
VSIDDSRHPYFEKIVVPGLVPSLEIRRFCALRAARIARLLILRCSLLKASMELSEAVSMACRAGRAGDFVELSPCAMACTSTQERGYTSGWRTSVTAVNCVWAGIGGKWASTCKLEFG